jgi:hypothetical protein
MCKSILTICLLFGLTISSHKSLAASFYATAELQMKTPLAFVLQAESSKFLIDSIAEVKNLGTEFVKEIAKDPELLISIQNWSELTIEEQVPLLRKVFKIECQILKIKEPKLIIENDVIPGAAFFEFDPSQPGTGIVYLNPNKFSIEEKYQSLALLIHETRHSAQFQLAFSGSSTSLAKSYKAAFINQKKLQGTLGFCDFLTLANEYEAFLFGNYVLGKLLKWQLDMPSMGTFASQFDEHANLKIDLVELTKHVGPLELLSEFNKLEIEQKRILTQGE